MIIKINRLNINNLEIFLIKKKKYQLIKIKKMDPIIGMIFYFCIAIFISFTCSILEAALLSTPVSYIQSKVDQGSKSAKKLLKLKNEKIDDAISAILTWNTIAHSVGVACFTNEAIKVFGDTYLGIITGFITFSILILSELIPKSVGAHYWKSLTWPTANITSWMITISYPLVWVAKWVMDVFKPKEKEVTISREEVSSMVSIGKEEKVFTEREFDIIQNLLAMKKITVKDIMTPKSVVIPFDINTKLSDFPKDFEFSRIPVFDGDEDNIIGIAYKTDIYQECDSKYPNKTIKDTDFDNEIIFIQEDQSINHLFEKFLKTRQHMGIVVDVYGTFIGVVTFEDVVETIFNVEILDETDKVEDMQEYAKKKWEERKSEIGFTIVV